MFCRGYSLCETSLTGMDLLLKEIKVQECDASKAK